jgi:hypothetical protein
VTSVSSSTPVSVTCLPPALTVTVTCGSAASLASVYAAGVVTSPSTETGTTGRPLAYAGAETPAVAPARAMTTPVVMRAALSEVHLCVTLTSA